MIYCFNTDDLLTKEIKNISSKSKEITSIFICWIPTNDQKQASALLKQTKLIEKYAGKIPIVIYDYYQSITNSEYEWLNKFNIIFFEPVIQHRNNFKYLPHWTKIKKFDEISLNNKEKLIKIGYVSNTLEGKYKQFNKYYTKIREYNMDDSISYYCDVSDDFKEEMKKISIYKDNISYKDIQFSVILNTFDDDVKGYLNYSFIKSLENNCIPIIPKENRFYSSLPFTTDNSSWYNIYKGMYDKIYIGMIKEIYDYIEKYYPEMDVKNTIEVLKKYLK